MKLSTQAFASASASHPRRAIGTLLDGSLTMEGNPTNNPQSQRAKDVLSRAFPPTVSAAVTDIVVVYSSRYTVDAPQFRALVRGLAATARQAGGVDSVRTYLDARDPAPVAKDRQATMVQFADASDDGIDDIVGAVERADARPGFAVFVTGQKILDGDLNKLTQSDTTISVLSLQGTQSASGQPMRRRPRSSTNDCAGGEVEDRTGGRASTVRSGVYRGRPNLGQVRQSRHQRVGEERFERLRRRTRRGLGCEVRADAYASNAGSGELSCQCSVESFN
jgi:hypothetical protein